MTKRLATTLMLLAAVVAGGIATLVLDRVLHRPPETVATPLSPHGRRGSPMTDRRGDPHDWATRELHLSPAQRAQIDSLMNRQREEFRALREETQPRFDSISARTRRAIESVLTPEQRQKMDSVMHRHPSS